MQLTKTNYLQFLKCPKSLWILKHKPHLYPKSTTSKYEEKLAAEGYQVQKLVEQYLLQGEDTNKYSFEKPYQTDEGLYAMADIISRNEDGSVNVYEVKSTGSIYKEHLIDATFQTITIEKSGTPVKSIYVVHLNKDYVRDDELNVGEMMVFSEVTAEVHELINDTTARVEIALKILNQPVIDETSCSCLELSKSHHCESFDYFNPKIPKPSIYNLPRIHKNKILKFSSEGRYNLNEIDEDEVSGNQLNVLRAAKTNTAVIDNEVIKKFYEEVEYPVYFLDYETYSSAIPFVKGAKPHSHIPFQYSLHVKQGIDDEAMQHFEYLANNTELPIKMVESMEKLIGTKGSIVTWHKSFENTRNKEMGILYPHKADFLTNISDRTIDLEDIFKGGYVDIAFGGSTSIKKVLPVIVPELTYEGMEVANGTDAMEAFIRMLEMPNGSEKEKLRKDMLAYCELDTLAMVRIFDQMREHC